MSNPDRSSRQVRPLEEMAQTDEQSQLERFEIAADFSQGDGSPPITAHRLYYDRATGVERLVAEAGTFEIYDAGGFHAGIADPGFVGSTHGDRGWCIWSEDSRRQEIVTLENLAHAIWFMLSEDMGSTNVGEATATVDDYRFGRDPTNYFDPSLVVKDFSGKYENAKSGDKGCALYYPEANEYRIISLGDAGSIIRFETTAAKILGGNVIGQTLLWNAAAYALDGVTIGLVDALGIFGPVSSGATGWAVRMADRPTVTISTVDYDAYEIIFMEDPARFIEVTLTENMGATTVQEASATVNDYYGNPSNGLSPGTSLNVIDEQNLFSTALSDAKGMAVFDERSNEYHLIRCEVQAKIVQFTTTEDMGATTTDKASVTLADYFHGQFPGATGTITDANSVFGRAISGAKGHAVYDDRSSLYHAVECETEVVGYIGQLVGALATTDTTKGVDNLEAMGEGQTRRVTSATAITSNNRFSGEGDDNGLVKIEYNKTNDDWDIITGACPA